MSSHSVSLAVHPNESVQFTADKTYNAVSTISDSASKLRLGE